MKKLNLLLAITTLSLVTSCGNVEGSTKELDCLDKSEREFLDQARQTFETALKVYYKTEDIDEMYLNFLDAFAHMELPPQFFVNKPTFQIIEELYSNEYQGNYWASDSEEDAEMFLLYTNVESPWFSCLAKNIQNDDLNETFTTMGELSELSPGILAGAFKESLKDYELNNEIKEIIALTFYYQQSLTLFLNMED